MNKNVLITGASKGIGLAIAGLFSDNGYNIISPSHSDLDLSLDASVDDFLSKSHVSFDIIINNAGINPIAETDMISDHNIADTLKINLISPLRLIRAILPNMAKNNYGRILNISSVWSLVSKPGRGIYSASKAALDALTRTIAVEFASKNILVNSIAPGYVDTELTKKNNSRQELDAIAKKIPIGRLAEPMEIAQLALFLCSDKNTFITGQTIVIDGGYTCL